MQMLQSGPLVLLSRLSLKSNQERRVSVASALAPLLMQMTARCLQETRRVWDFLPLFGLHFYTTSEKIVKPDALCWRERWSEKGEEWTSKIDDLHADFA
ncbi:hypothetical protein F2P81_022002 [Scophthalmus maximus]|uniref:Uncharacterized protein n=1 Tax=Scophthalmus maximus TaxID=52904 RepID=A0A6A4S1R7_SCOMX|nr:hypothetical protein F2P81_022002 [Scophthalmus maximus]